MWILSFVPDSFLVWVINISLLIGFVLSGLGFVGSRLPGLSKYSISFRVIGIVIFCIAVYFKGGYGVEKEWRDKVKQMEEKIKIAEEKSKEVNVVIETKYVDRIRRIKEVKEVVVEKVKEVEKIIDAKCEIPSQAIKLLNDAAVTP